MLHLPEINGLPSHFTVREINSTDDITLASIIRGCLSEFGAAKPGTVFYDPTTDALSQLFRAPGSMYFVALEGEQILGGAGIFPTAALPAGTAELVKLYLKPGGRNKGIGKYLMLACEAAALSFGYEQLYLETLPELRFAIPLYERMGYQYLDKPMGDSGHSGCNVWMLKKLVATPAVQ